MVSLREILFLIAFLFTNPFVPDFGLQLLVATVIGLILPEFIVRPLDQLISKIPGVTRFKSFLSKNKRLSQIIPRVIAGYVITYLIGWTSLVIALYVL
ncbi:MAG: hypothetical protein LUO93_01110 [Methanomicrobiales archaeon]|nr:hypothetical protein [Methanomicrobiales archaeon]